LLLILTDLRLLHPPWNLAIGENEKCMLKTRDIPTLTNPSPPSHQRRFQSPLSATARIPSKYAGIGASLLFLYVLSNLQYICGKEDKKLIHPIRWLEGREWNHPSAQIGGGLEYRSINQAVAMTTLPLVRVVSTS
jgi:hypothetical protein